MVRESDEAGAFNIALIEHIARKCLSHGLVVVVEGILDADRYGGMLERLSATAERALFYSFDLSFEETLLRHAGRPLAEKVSGEVMAQWYHGWQPLTFVEEARIDASWTADRVVERIYGDVARIG